MALQFLPLIIGAALTAGSAIMRNRAMQQADNAQMRILQQQRQAFAEQRAMTERRQAQLAEQLRQDEALRERGRAEYQQALQNQAPEGAQATLDAEKVRMADLIAPEQSVGDLNASVNAFLTGKTQPEGAGEVQTDGMKVVNQAGITDDLSSRLKALGTLTAYDTAGAIGDRDLGQRGTMVGFYGNERKQGEDAYQRRMNVLRSGEQAMGAAGEALGNQVVNVDTRLADLLGGVGQMGMMYGMGGFGGFGGTSNMTGPFTNLNGFNIRLPGA
jgi:hypothetical protein